MRSITKSGLASLNQLYRNVLMKCNFLNRMAMVGFALGAVMVSAPNDAQAYDWTTDFNVDNGVYYLKNENRSTPNSLRIGYYKPSLHAMTRVQYSYLSAIIDDTVTFGDADGTAQEATSLSYNVNFPINILDGNQFEVKYDSASASEIEEHRSGTIADFNKTKFRVDVGNSNGALLNDATITKISADFIKNNGLAIRNLDGATITEIDSNFIENGTNFYDRDTINSAATAAINNEGSIGTITGSFLRNRGVRPDVASGGAIQNSGIINSVDADFVSNAIVVNHHRSYTNWDLRGGAIANISSSRLDSVTGDFIDNSIYAQYSDPSKLRRIFMRGGAIYNEGGNGQVNVSGNFIANKINSNVITQGTFNLSGGAVYNSAYMNISGGDFISNQIIAGGSSHGTADVEAYKHVVRGGAVYNSGVMTIADAEFNNNIIDYKYNVIGGNPALAPTVQGGAIYNATGAHLTLNATTDDVLFIGNRVMWDYSTYSDAIWNNGTVNLRTTGDNQIITYDDFLGYNGVYNLYGTLNLRGDANFGDNTSLVLHIGGIVSIIDGVIQDKHITAIDVADSIVVGVDANPNTKEMEKVTQTQDGYATYIGKINFTEAYDANIQDRRVGFFPGVSTPFAYNIVASSEAFGHNDTGFYKYLGRYEKTGRYDFFESIANTFEGAVSHNQANKGYYFDASETSAGGTLKGTNLEVLSNNKATLTLTSDLNLESSDSLTLTQVSNIKGSAINTNGAELTINLDDVRDEGAVGGLKAGRTTISSEITGGSDLTINNSGVLAANVALSGGVALGDVNITNATTSFSNIGNGTVNTYNSITTDNKSDLYFYDGSHAISGTLTANGNFMTIGGTRTILHGDEDAVLDLSANGASVTGDARINMILGSEIKGNDDTNDINRRVDNNISIYQEEAYSTDAKLSNLDLYGRVSTWDLDTVKSTFTNVNFYGDANLNRSTLAGNNSFNGNGAYALDKVTNNGVLDLTDATVTLVNNIGGTGSLKANGATIKTDDGAIGTHTLGTLADGFAANLVIDATIDLTDTTNNSNDVLEVSDVGLNASFNLLRVNIIGFTTNDTILTNTTGILEIFSGTGHDGITLTGDFGNFKETGNVGVNGYELLFSAEGNDIKYTYNVITPTTLANVLGETGTRTYRMSANEAAGTISDFSGNMTVTHDGNEWSIAKIDPSDENDITFRNSAGNVLTLDHVSSEANINFTGSSEENKNILNIRSNGAGNRLTTTGMIQTIGTNYDGNEVNFMGSGSHNVNASISSSTVNITATGTDLNRGISYSTVNIMGATTINEQAEESTFNVGAATTDYYGLKDSNTVNVMANVDGTSDTVFTATDDTNAKVNLLGANSGAVNKFVINSDVGARIIGSNITSTAQTNVVAMTGANDITLNSDLSNVTLNVDSTSTNTLAGDIDNSVMNVNQETTSNGAITNSTVNINGVIMEGTGSIASSIINTKNDTNLQLDVDGSTINIVGVNIGLQNTITNSVINFEDAVRQASIFKGLGSDVTINMLGSDNSKVNTLILDGTETVSAVINSANIDNKLSITGAKTVASNLNNLTVNVNATSTLSGAVTNSIVDATSDTIFTGSLANTTVTGGGDVGLNDVSTDSTVNLNSTGSKIIDSSGAVTTGATATGVVAFTGTGSHELTGSFAGVNINGTGTNTINGATITGASNVNESTTLNGLTLTNAILNVATGKTLTNTGTVTGANGEINLNGATLVVGAGSNFSDTTDLVMQAGSVLNAVNNSIDTLNFDTVTAAGTMKLDLDLVSGTIDTIITAGNSTGAITLDSVNLIGDLSAVGDANGTLQIFNPVANSTVDVNIMNPITYYTVDKKVVLTENALDTGSVNYTAGDRSGETLNSVADANTNASNTIYEMATSEELTVSDITGRLEIKGNDKNITGAGFGIDADGDVIISGVDTVESTDIALNNATSKLTFNDVDVINSNITGVAGSEMTFENGTFSTGGTFSTATMNIKNGATVTRDNTDSELTYNLEGTLAYSQDSFLANGGNNAINFMGGTLNLANRTATQGITLGSIDLAANTTSRITLDVDLASSTPKMDTLNPTTVNVGTDAKLNAKLFVTADAADETPVIVDFIDETNTEQAKLLNAITTSSEISGLSSLYKYDVAYDNTNGEFTFTRGDASSASTYNPVRLVSGTGKAVAGANAVRTTGRLFDVTGTPLAQPVENVPSGDVNTNPFASTWVDVYASSEDVKLDDITVENDTQNFIVGADTTKHTVGDFETVYSLYAGYIGSSQDYDTVSIDQNGFIVGGRAMLNRDNVFSTFVANIGYSFGEASTASGSEEFDTLNLTIANKTGMNIALDGGKFTFKPAMVVGYHMISTDDYTNSAGDNVSNDALHIFNIAPELRIEGNFEGVTPYLSAAYNWNIDSGGDVTIDNITSPTLSAESYAEFKLGASAQFENNLNGYAEVIATTGDVDGFGGKIGLKYDF